MRAVHDVGDELAAKRQIDIVAIDKALLLAINHEQVVARLVHANIRILARLNVTLGTKNEQAAIAPRTQAVWRKPVQPHIAEATIASQHHIAKVLELWM